MSSAYGTTGFGRSDKKPVVGGVYAGNTRGGSCAVTVVRPTDCIRGEIDLMLFVADTPSLCLEAATVASCVFALTELVEALCRDWKAGAG